MVAMEFVQQDIREYLINLHKEIRGKHHEGEHEAALHSELHAI